MDGKIVSKLNKHIQLNIKMKYQLVIILKVCNSIYFGFDRNMRKKKKNAVYI